MIKNDVYYCVVKKVHERKTGARMEIIMTYEIVIPVIIAFAISALLGPVVIPFLRRLKVGQTERKELESHLKKNGTPTMGGLMILASIIITSLFYVKDYPDSVYDSRIWCDRIFG